jgi:hypothetical protein
MTLTILNMPMERAHVLSFCTGWKRRFFELKGAVLEYKAREKDKLTPLGAIVLVGASVHVTVAHSSAGVLEISSPQQTRIFYLRYVISALSLAHTHTPHHTPRPTYSVATFPPSLLLLILLHILVLSFFWQGV